MTFELKQAQNGKEPPARGIEIVSLDDSLDFTYEFRLTIQELMEEMTTAASGERVPA
jgi:hypothetical protein